MTDASSVSSDRFVDDMSKPDDAIDLRGIIITLRKHKWPIILTTALLTALTALYVSSITPQYRATASLLFENNRAQTGFETPWAELDNDTLAMQTQVEVLKSRTLAARVVDELKLSEHWEYNTNLPVPDAYKSSGLVLQLTSRLAGFFPNGSATKADVVENVDAGKIDQGTMDSMVRRLMGRTSVTILKQTNIIKVSVAGADRVLAAEIANGIGVAYASFYLEQSAGRNKDAKSFLEEKVADLKVRLDQSEQELLRERRRAGLSGDGGDISEQTIALFNNRLVDAKTKFENSRIQWEEVQQLSLIHI